MEAGKFERQLTNKDRVDQKAVNGGAGQRCIWSFYPLFMKPFVLAGSMGKVFLRMFQEGGKIAIRSIRRASWRSFFLYLCTNPGWNRTQIAGL